MRIFDKKLYLCVRKENIQHTKLKEGLKKQMLIIKIKQTILSLLILGIRIIGVIEYAKKYKS